MTDLLICATLLLVEQQTLVSTAEAAEIIGRSIATVNRFVREGLLAPAMQYPGSTGARMYHRADVEALRAEVTA